MNKRVYQMFFSIVLISLIISIFFDYKLAISLSISYVIGLVSHLMTMQYVTQSLERKETNRKRFVLLTIMKIIMYVLGFSFYLLYPNYAIIVSVLFGFTLIPICIYVDNFIDRKGGHL